MKIQGTIRTGHTSPECVAGAISPDNLSAMETMAWEGCVETRIEGTALRSVIASVDDYLMNLAIAEETCSVVPGESPGVRETPSAIGMNRE
jgi:hypothetical protein